MCETFRDEIPSRLTMPAASALDNFVKQQGVAVWGDDEDGAALLGLLPPHELIIHVEHCVATRPSRTGSLSGSSQKYAEMFACLQAALKPLEGQGGLTVVTNERTQATAEGAEALPPAASSTGTPGTQPNFA